MMEPVNIAQFIEYRPNEMSSYKNIPTPPMSGSDGSQSPLMYSFPEYNGTVPSYFEGMSLDDHFNDHPHLEIVEQPVEKFRFRYKSEMAGTHGSLNGVNTEKNRKQTFPTVRLKHYNAQAVMRCSLYQWNPNTSSDNWQPHAHRLVQKSGNEEVDDPHDKIISSAQNYEAIFNNMGIIHTAKKYLVSEMLKKKHKLALEDIKRKEGKSRSLKVSEESELLRSANEESKSINLNIVCLRFDAFYERNGILQPICQPIFTHAINNLKSALTGELKINRMDRSSCPAVGGKDIFLLVEKVTKKNIKVRFFELDDNEAEVWYAYGKFNDIDVHHQYAIVAKIPAYKDANIEMDVKVYIELERPSDGARSSPLDFTYHPDRTSKRKRPRMYDSSSSFSSTEIPLTVPELSPFVTSKEMEDLAKAVNSEEFMRIMESYDLQEASNFQNNYQTDASHKTDPSYKSWQTAEKQIARAFSELISFLKTNPAQARTVKMLDKWIRRVVDNEGNNALHLSYIHLHHIAYKNLIDTIIQLIIECKQTELLNIINKDSNTILHIALEKDSNFLLGKLINIMDLTIKNCDGFTVLHIAVENNSRFEEVLKSKNVKDFINIRSDGDYTPLQLALKKNNLLAIKALCAAGADVNVIDNKTGGNLIHMCIDSESPCLDIVKFLVNETAIDLKTRNYRGDTCQAVAKNCDVSEICKIIEDKLISLGTFEECFVKEEPESDEEMEIETSSVKVENLSEDEIRELYGQVIHFTPDCLEQMSRLLDPMEKWKALPPLLDLNYVIATRLLDDRPKPTMAFLKFALNNGVSIYQIRTHLVHLNEFEAVKYIDDMVFNSE